MSDQDSKPYEVGYKRPPQNRRFRAGQSGNPKGRPKGSKNLGSILMKELNTRIPVTENGKQKTMTKREAIVKRSVNAALSGDFKTTNMILNDLRSREEKELGPESAGYIEPLAAEDELVMESIIQRIRNCSAPLNTSATDEDSESDLTGDK